MLVMSALSLAQSLAAFPAYTSAFSPSRGLYEFLALTYMLSMCQYVLSTTLTGESTARVGQRGKGTLLGLEHSIFAAVRVFSPKIGVLLLQGGVASVAATCSVVFAGMYGAWQLGTGGSLTLRSSNKVSGGERKEK
jgi:hypothetical protein